MSLPRPTILATPVLIVEDSSPVRTMVRRMLFDIGLRNTMEAGDVAVAALQKFTPGLIVVDWYLPEGTCEQLVMLIRDPRRSSCPGAAIIALTGRPTVAVVDTAHRLGINSLLRKPFSPRMLWDHVSAALPRSDGGGAQAGASRVGDEPRPSLPVRTTRL